jgi:hypothetical protein
MQWKRVKVALLIIGLGVTGASAAVAVPASAATTPATTTVHLMSQHNIPAATLWVTFFYATGTDSSRCFVGNSDTILPPEWVSNGCTTRVRLFQYQNETGYSLCLRPNTSTGHLHRGYNSFRVLSGRVC